jgi:hypothetical protein
MQLQRLSDNFFTHDFVNIAPLNGRRYQNSSIFVRTHNHTNLTNPINPNRIETFLPKTGVEEGVEQ